MESIGHIQVRSLVREAQGGNQAAFTQLVHTYDQAALRLAWRLTGSESEAQDIYQEAFIKAYMKLNGFRFECSFATWIYRIVANVCLDHLRRNQARKRDGAIEVSDDDLLNQMPDDRPANNPEQQLMDRELSAQIRRAMKGLAPRERMVFDLKHFHGLTLRGVSEILNIPEGTIKMAFYRATRKLRLQLDRYIMRNRSSITQWSDNGVNQRQKAKRLVITTSLAATVNTPMPKLRPATPNRLLIIGSNDALQKTLQVLFSSEGYEVDLVSDGLAGLQMLRQRGPSAVIVDLRPPGPLGADLCRTIANLMPGLPVVILSASSEVADKVLLLEAGADDYVTIPFSSRELVARLRALIKRASRVGPESLYFDQAGCS